MTLPDPRSIARLAVVPTALALLGGCAAATVELSQGQRWIQETEDQYARDGARGFSPWRNFPAERVSAGR
ncbi:MAG: hypothetical protein M5U08_22525 [Burkholderiales bacterium]|nr:hypothetical protein [Burkholderiales bacterium]